MLDTCVDDLLLRREAVGLQVLSVLRDDCLTIGAGEHEVAEAESEVCLTCVVGIALFGEAFGLVDIIQQEVRLEDHTIDVFPVGGSLDDTTRIARAELPIVLRLVRKEADLRQRREGVHAVVEVEVDGARRRVELSLCGECIAISDGILGRQVQLAGGSQERERQGGKDIAFH